MVLDERPEFQHVARSKKPRAPEPGARVGGPRPPESGLGSEAIFEGDDCDRGCDCRGRGRGEAIFELGPLREKALDEAPCDPVPYSELLEVEDVVLDFPLRDPDELCEFLEVEPCVDEGEYLGLLGAGADGLYAGGRGDGLVSDLGHLVLLFALLTDPIYTRFKKKSRTFFAGQVFIFQIA
jgi:hypothetical protein